MFIDVFSATLLYYSGKNILETFVKYLVLYFFKEQKLNKKKEYGIVTSYALTKNI